MNKHKIQHFIPLLKPFPTHTTLNLRIIYFPIHDPEQELNETSQPFELLEIYIILNDSLVEIRGNEKLKDLSVVIFSTSYPQDKSYELGMISNLFNLGARVYIRKPTDFDQLKQLIDHALRMVEEKITSNVRLNYILNA